MIKSSLLRGAIFVAALSIAIYFALPCAVRVDAGQNGKTSDAPAGNAENGKRLFTKDGCYECHGREGQGSNMAGPRIAPDPIPFDSLVRYVRKPSGEMPPYTAMVVSDQELADIYSFLQSRPHPPTAKAGPLLK
jgi:mono/diheme cytochrome c family protein